MDKLLQASPHQGLQVQNLSGQWIDVPPIHGSLVINIGKGGMIPFSAQCHFWYSLTKLLSLSPAVSLEPHLTEFYHQKARPQDTRSHSSRISLCRFDWQTRYLIVRHCDYLIKEDSMMLLQCPLKSWNYAMNGGPSYLRIVCYARASIHMEPSCWHFHLAINFSEYDREPSGKVNLIGRVKSVLVDSQAESDLFSYYCSRSHPDTGKIHYPELFREIFPNGYTGKESVRWWDREHRQRSPEVHQTILQVISVCL